MDRDDYKGSSAAALADASHPRMRLELVKKHLGRSVLFHPVFVHVTHSVTASLMLSQALYWARTWSAHPEQSCGNGWFCKTTKEWQDETGLTRREQETARKILRDVGFFEEKKQGMPAKLFYRINLDRVAESVEGWHQISFYRSLIGCTNSATASLMLSHAIGLTAKVLNKRPDGWFCKSIKNWQEETGLSRHEQETARRILRDIGLMDERRPLTNKTTMLYRINLGRLESLFAHRLVDLDEKPRIEICADDDSPCDDLLEESTVQRVIRRASIPELDNTVLVEKSLAEALGAGPKLIARNLAENQPVEQKKKATQRHAVRPSFNHPWVKDARDGVRRSSLPQGETK